MAKPLQSKHHYNICERDSDGTLWVIDNNCKQEDVKEFLKGDNSMYSEIVVVLIETNTFDVSFEFMEND